MSTTQLEQPKTTTGLVCMWDGTKDGEDGHYNHITGETNVNTPKQVKITVEDVRTANPQPQLNKQGYELIKFDSSLPLDVFVNASEPENKKLIESTYFEECRKTVQKVTGAKEAYPYVFRIRNQEKHISEVANADFHGDAVPIVHVDRDIATAPARLRHTLGEEKANELMGKYKRWAACNVWKPLKNNVEKWPLLLVDHENVENWHYDTNMARIVFSNDKRVSARGSKSHETIGKEHPQNKYVYASNMQTDDAWLFYAYHHDPKLGIPHSAFWDNNTKDDAQTRWSIETRTWVFWDDE